MASHLGFTLSGLSKEDAYNKITTEISRLEGQIRSLYSLQNNLAPVSSLPTELLSKIFMHCCDLNESGEFTDIRPEEGEEEGEDRAYLDSRLVVSWVSRQWRSVALGHRPLWNLVMNDKHIFNLDYAGACIDRCQNLYIDAQSPPPDLFGLCTSRLSQICCLKIDDFGDEEEQTHSLDWPAIQSAPLLQSLVLGGLGLAAIFLDSIGSETCPRLHSLNFDRIRIDWNMFPRLASTLTNLKITYPISKTTAVQFINILESLQLLTRCELSRCFTSDVANTTSPSLHHAYLSQLRFLSVVDKIGPITDLLRGISAPAATLRFIIFKSRTSDIKTLFQTLQVTQGQVWGSILHLRFDYALTASSSSSFPAQRIYHLGSYLETFLLACQTFNLDKLESLGMIDGSKDIMEKVSRLAHLRKITFESSKALAHFVEYLEPLHTEAMTLFPALQELIFVEFNSGNSIGGLYNVLSLRKISGCPLKRIDFVGCESIKTRDIAMLRKVVDIVDISEG